MGKGSGETLPLEGEIGTNWKPKRGSPPEVMVHLGGETTSRQWLHPCPDTVAKSQAGLDRQSPEWRVTWEFPFGNRIWVQLVGVLKPHQGLGGSRFVLVRWEELPLYREVGKKTFRVRE